MKRISLILLCGFIGGCPSVINLCDDVSCTDTEICVDGECRENVNNFPGE